MEDQVANIQAIKDEIQRLVKEHPGNEDEIQGILDSLDQMCGLSA